MNYTKEQVQNIIVEAQQAARKAADTFLQEKLGGKDAWPCGFAWVDVYGVKGNTKLGKIMKELNFRQEMWNPAKIGVQNMDVLYAGAQAAAVVLENYGFKAFAQERID